MATSVGKSLYAEKLTSDNIASSSYTRQIKHRYDASNNGQTTATKGLMTFATNFGTLTMNLPAPEQDGDVIEVMYVAGGNALTLDATGFLYGTANEIQFGTTSGQYVKLVAYADRWFIAGRDSAQPATANTVAGLPVLAV
jgi:hypothetical protein